MTSLRQWLRPPKALLLLLFLLTFASVSTLAYLASASWNSSGWWEAQRSQDRLEHGSRPDRGHGSRSPGEIE
jgi:hypothetical protein